MSDQKQQASILRQAAGLVLQSGISVDIAAQALIPLPPPQQALAIATAWQRAMDGISATGANSAAEQHGRRIEKVMDELPDFQAPLREMIEAGDTEIILGMVRGRVGEISSAAQHLDAKLIALLFEKDADMQDDNAHDARLINMAWTLVMETPVDHQGINVFFLATNAGRVLADELRSMVAGGDEEAQQIVRSLNDREYHLPVNEEGGEGE